MALSCEMFRCQALHDLSMAACGWKKMQPFWPTNIPMETNIPIPAAMHGLVNERGNLCEEGSPSPEACKAQETGSRVAEHNLIGPRWLRFLALHGSYHAGTASSAG